MKRLGSGLVLILMLSATAAHAQNSSNDVLKDSVDRPTSRVQTLERENQKLEKTQRQLVNDSGGAAVVLFLFGAVCALWAQNTGRNAWLWFFLGLFFNIITVFFLLSKNAGDLRDKQPPKALF